MRRVEMSMGMFVGYTVAQIIAGAVIGASAGIDWYKREHPPTITIQRAAPAPAQAVMLIRCPASAREILEWQRVCRSRARSDAVKPNGE